MKSCFKGENSFTHLIYNVRPKNCRESRSSKVFISTFERVSINISQRLQVSRPKVLFVIFNEFAQFKFLKGNFIPLNNLARDINRTLKKNSLYIIYVCVYISPNSVRDSKCEQLRNVISRVIP